MKKALEIAEKGQQQGEVPIGALIVEGSTIISTATNEIISRKDPIAHAEILSIQRACVKKGELYLTQCDLYVTLEPCPMCAQAISFARLRRLYFGAYDPKRGGVDHGPQIFNASSCFHQPEVIGGLLEKQCAHLLLSFFETRR